MRAQVDPLDEMIGETIETLAGILHRERLPDTVGLVCWDPQEPGNWDWGDNPKPGEQCEPSHEYVSRRGDTSDGWKVLHNAAWAISLWDAITDPEPGTSQRELLAWAVNLGVIIREIEEIGLVDEDGLTLLERANLGKRFAQKSTERATLAKVQKGERRKKHIVNTVRRLLGAGLGRFKSGRINQSFLAKHYCEISDAELGERRVREIIGDAIQAGKLE